ncbi:MAG: hypothetical protein GYA57_15750 [Myxococcales bacterium]|nr:hypothetical protein [Myxococcales bacterium]
MRGRKAWLIALWGTLGAACGHDWSAAADDAGTGEADVVVEGTGGDDGGDAAVEADGADAGGDAEAGGSDDAPADGRPDAPAACGDGIVDPDEVCDDGDTETEWCGGDLERACLSDCSLRLQTCGDGRLDPGEACDDGNLDSFDECTTSCTANDHGIGAPCRCVADCNDYDFSAGRFEGCESVPEPVDGVARITCFRTLSAFGWPLEIRAAEGYCTWMAVVCDGADAVCSMIPHFGSAERFECPSGYVPRAATAEVLGSTITVLYCARPCSLQRDCRWNAVEGETSPWAGQCGHWTCITPEGGGPSFCDDPRNPG